LKLLKGTGFRTKAEVSRLLRSIKTRGINPKKSNPTKKSNGFKDKKFMGMAGVLNVSVKIHQFNSTFQNFILFC
jgi:hypothetical protein